MYFNHSTEYACEIGRKLVIFFQLHYRFHHFIYFWNSYIIWYIIRSSVNFFIFVLKVFKSLNVSSRLKYGWYMNQHFYLYIILTNYLSQNVYYFSIPIETMYEYWNSSSVMLKTDITQISFQNFILTHY